MLDSWRLGNMVLLKHGNIRKASAAIGISKDHMYKLCEGRATPSVALLERMADHFNCSTDYLLGRADR